MQVDTEEKDMESLEENHRVEVRVYSQKVKHLEYEHKNNVKKSGVEGGKIKVMIYTNSTSCCGSRSQSAT